MVGCRWLFWPVWAQLPNLCAKRPVPRASMWPTAFSAPWWMIPEGFWVGMMRNPLESVASFGILFGFLDGLPQYIGYWHLHIPGWDHRPIWWNVGWPTFKTLWEILKDFKDTYKNNVLLVGNLIMFVCVSGRMIVMSDVTQNGTLRIDSMKSRLFSILVISCEYKSIYCNVYIYTHVCNIYIWRTQPNLLNQHHFHQQKRLSKKSEVVFDKSSPSPWARLEPLQRKAVWVGIVHGDLHYPLCQRTSWSCMGICDLENWKCCFLVFNWISTWGRKKGSSWILQSIYT